MQKRVLAAVAAVSFLLAGCADPAAEPAAEPGSSTAMMTIVGLVQDDSFVPVSGAAVELRLLNRSTTTDAGGNFRIDGLLPSAYLVDVRAAGYEVATLTAEPSATLNASLNFILERPASLRPSAEVVHFKGILECAFEAVIISPSCDTLVEAVGGPDLTQDTATFDLGVNRNWTAIAVDVDFDPSASPGLDGLRLVVRGLDDGNQLTEYQQYGRFNAPQPFTAVIEPGATYDDGVGPVPANTTAFRFEVYPQSHGWHATCDATCALGVGTGTDVQFDLYITIFHNQKVPDGYTFLAS